jgi:AraC-like DNA-binding protein
MNGPTLYPLPDIVSVLEDTAESIDRSRAKGARTSVDILSIYTEGGPYYRVNHKTYKATPPFALLLPQGSLDHDLQKGKIYGVCVLFKGNGLVKAKTSTEVESVLGHEKALVPMLKELSVADAGRLLAMLKELRLITGAGLVAQFRRTAKLFEGLAEYCFCPGRTGNKAIHREAIRLRDLVQAYAFENTSLKKIYEETHLSPAYAKTLFRKAFGVTPVEYRIQLRLRRSRELLTSSQLNVSQTAFAVGFNDPLYFSKLFHQTYGMPPSRLILDFDNSRKKALP